MATQMERRTAYCRIGSALRNVVGVQKGMEKNKKEPADISPPDTSMRHLQKTDMSIKTATKVFWMMPCLMCPGVRTPNKLQVTQGV